MDIKNKTFYGYLVSFLMFLLLGYGYTSGIKGALTWGPTNDFWAISIAISDLEYDLEGYLGYREVSQVLANTLSEAKSDTNVHSLKTRDLVQNPPLVSLAINNAANLDKSILKEGNKYRGHYLNYSEDVGFIDFYKISFSLFGYHANSSYYLYIIIYLISLGVLFLRYRKNHTVMVLSLFITVGIISAANSILMSDLMIAISSNRFISTLCFIPLLHIFFEGSVSNKTYFNRRILFLSLQILLLFFVFTVRISSLWALLLLIFIVSIKLIYLLFKAKTINLKKVLLTSGLNYFLISVLLILIGGSYKIMQYYQLDRIYHTQDMMPHHLVWHSAYIGLSFHPNWNNHLQFEDLKGAHGDSIPFIVTNKMLEGTGVSIVGGASGGSGTKNRMHDQIVKKQFFKFLADNPMYVLELYFYHKPIKMFKTLLTQIKSAKSMTFIFAVMAIFYAIFVLLQKRINRIDGHLLFSSSFLIMIFSFLPILWSYPAPFVLADQYVSFYVFIMSFFTVISLILCKIFKRTICINDINILYFTTSKTRMNDYKTFEIKITKSKLFLQRFFSKLDNFLDRF